jgi:hypothetical protein
MYRQTFCVLAAACQSGELVRLVQGRKQIFSRRLFTAAAGKRINVSQKRKSICVTMKKPKINTLVKLRLQKNFMWNTVTVQYNPLIEEEWDEHFKVTCEYGYDFWKTVTFPFLDVE